MGRPKKPVTGRRVIRLHVRLTAAEETALDRQAAEAGRNVSDFVREAALNSKPRFKKADPERAALIRGLGELGKVGSNVNQIAKELHRERIVGTGPRVPDHLIAAALQAIQALGKHLINILTGGH